jgi:T-complex protein 1 subunit gamma
MEVLDIWEPVAVKKQVIKTAIETASLLLRIDAIVAGMKKPQADAGASAPPPDPEGGEGPQ